LPSVWVGVPKAWGQLHKNEGVKGAIEDVDMIWKWFLQHEGVGGNLTAADRKRLVGAGVRNNGFIDKAA
jgi:hypothetical protein